MLAKALLSHILGNEALTRGLGDPEARMLVEWLVDQAELLASRQAGEEVLRTEVNKLCRRGRAISRFVGLWCHEGMRGGAVQLAATERFTWPLPTRRVDPCELMQTILDWEARQVA
jgi:hypothetical protein